MELLVMDLLMRTPPQYPLWHWRGWADCRYDGKPMGIAAEHTAKKYDFSREDQDDFAISSYKRAQAAAAAGHFHEIEPVQVAGVKGKPSVIVKDDEDAKNVRPLNPRAGIDAGLVERDEIEG